MSILDYKITAQDLDGKGNVGMPDTPNLTTQQMQEKLDELSLEVIVPAFNELVDYLKNRDFDNMVASRNIQRIVYEGGKLQFSRNGGVTFQDCITYGQLDGIPSINGRLVFGSAPASAYDLAKASDLASVATSGSYNDLTNKPQLKTVATSGSYNDLTNKPELKTVATSGSYNDLTEKPNLKAVATSGDYSDLSNTPELSTVATSGSYNDLNNKPNLSAVATSGSYEDLSNTPDFADVALSGSYEDLSNTPDLAPVATNGDFWSLYPRPYLSDVATSGNYNDLNGKPELKPVATGGELTDLDDVLIGGVEDGQVLVYSEEAGKWVNAEGGGGGGGGVTNYEQLSGKPQINDVTLSGNMSFSDLGLPQSAVTGSYSDLNNKPSINGVSLNGNKRLSEIGVHNSTKNLLDNGWFNINSRGQAAYSEELEMLTLDRWYKTASTQISINDGYIGLNSGGRIYQKVHLKPGTYTLSILYSPNILPGHYYSYNCDLTLADETSRGFSFTGPSDSWHIDNQTFTIDSECVEFGISMGNDHSGNIKAIKIEEGSTSTLTDDIAPDPYLERIRCITSTADPSDEYANKTIAVGGNASNPNILDNGWFNVNSRGQSSYSSTGYTIDRWNFALNAGEIRKNEKGITVAKNGTTGILLLRQYLKELYGGKYTLSVMDNAGNIVKTTYNVPDSQNYDMPPLIFGEYMINVYSSNGQRQVRIYGGTPNAIANIKAIKLEAGSISTLANDTAPNPAEELLRCKASTADATDTYANKGVLTDDAWVSTKTYEVGELFIDNNIMYRTKVRCSNVTPPNTIYYEPTSVGKEFHKFGEKNKVPGEGPYVSSAYLTYILFGKICVFQLEFTPNTDISTSVGAIGFNIPFAFINGSATTPFLSENENVTNRAVQIYSGNSMSPKGAYTSGKTYYANGIALIV